MSGVLLVDDRWDVAGQPLGGDIFPSDDEGIALSDPHGAHTLYELPPGIVFLQVAVGQHVMSRNQEVFHGNLIVAEKNNSFVEP